MACSGEEDSAVRSVMQWVDLQCDGDAVGLGMELRMELVDYKNGFGVWEVTEYGIGMVFGLFVYYSVATPSIG